MKNSRCNHARMVASVGEPLGAAAAGEEAPSSSSSQPTSLPFDAVSSCRLDARRARNRSCATVSVRSGGSVSRRSSASLSVDADARERGEDASGAWARGRRRRPCERSGGVAGRVLCTRSTSRCASALSPMIQRTSSSTSTEPLPSLSTSQNRRSRSASFNMSADMPPRRRTVAWNSSKSRHPDWSRSCRWNRRCQSTPPAV